MFVPARVAVFVDGCFWHSCPKHATAPRANGAWWAEKLQRNVKRDRDTDILLERAGWLPLHVWEHEDTTEAAETVHRVVVQRRTLLKTASRSAL